MFLQLNNPIYFQAPFVASKVGKTGLTVTVNVWRNGSSVVSGAAATEIGDGLYSYTLASGSVGTAGSYVAVFKTTDTTVDSQVVYSLWVAGLNWVQFIDGSIAALPGLIWNALTSTFTVAGSAGKRIVDFLTGDIFARIGVNGAGLTALGDPRLANLDAPVSTVGTLVANAILVNPANKIYTNASNQVLVGALSATAIQSFWDSPESVVYAPGSFGAKFKLWLLGADGGAKITGDAHTAGVTVANISSKTGYQLAASEHTAIVTDATTALTNQGVSPTRMGYLDKLNISGNVASSSEVAAIQNNTSTSFIVPELFERPTAGNRSLKLHLYIYDEVGNMEAPDSVPTLTVVNESGVSRAANVTAFALVAGQVGHFVATYTLASNAPSEQLFFEATVVEGGATRLVGKTAFIVDSAAVDFTGADRALLTAIAADYAKDYALAALATTTGQIKAATDRIPGAPAAVSDIPTAAQNAAAVWLYNGVRSLSTFGTLVTDIVSGVWGYTGGRVLSAFGFTVATTANQTQLDIKAQTDKFTFTGGNVNAQAQNMITGQAITDAATNALDAYDAAKTSEVQVTVPAPVVNLPAPIVNVAAPIVNPTPVTVQGGFTQEYRDKMDAIADQTSRMDSLIETVGGYNRLKETALEMAPVGEGGSGGGGSVHVPAGSVVFNPRLLDTDGEGVPLGLVAIYRGVNRIGAGTTNSDGRVEFSDGEGFVLLENIEYSVRIYAQGFESMAPFTMSLTDDAAPDYDLVALPPFPVSTDPDKAVIRVRTADFVGKPMANVIVRIILDDTQNVVIGNAHLLTREFEGVTKLHTDENGNQDAYVDIAVWHEGTLTDAGLNPIYILDMVGVLDCRIRVTEQGGLASQMLVPQEII
ncbi:hypothetical protein EON83_10930 [bacterium]|nr:MAG: hypothetical protein EON83_10930 [bacterium]